MESTNRLLKKNTSTSSERDIKKKLRTLLGCTEMATIKKEPQIKSNTSKVFRSKTNITNIKLEKNDSGSNKSLKEASKEGNPEKSRGKTETGKPKLQKSAATNKSVVKSKKVKDETKTKVSESKKPKIVANSTEDIKAPTKKQKSENGKTKTLATGGIKAPAKVVSKKEIAGTEKTNTVSKTIIKATRKDKKSLSEKDSQKGKTNAKTKQQLNTSNKKKELIKSLIKQQQEEHVIKPSKLNENGGTGTSKIKKEPKTIKSEVKPNLKRKIETKSVEDNQKVKAPKSKKPNTGEKNTKSKASTTKLQNNKIDDSTDEILSKFAKLVKLSKSNKVILPNSLKKLATNGSCPIHEKTVKKMAPTTVKSCNANAKRNINGKSEKKHLSKSNGFSKVNPAEFSSLDNTFDETENETHESHGSSFNSSWTSCSTDNESEASGQCDCDDCNSEASEECSCSDCSCSDCSNSCCDTEGEEEEEEGEEEGESEYDDEITDWSTDSSDYCPSNDNQNVYIPKGSAIKSDASVDCSKFFDSDADEAQIFEISDIWKPCLPTKNVRAIKYHEPEITEAESDSLTVSERNVIAVNHNVTVADKMDIDDNDSCPELIPIDFDSNLCGLHKEISTSDSSYTYEDDSSFTYEDNSSLSSISTVSGNVSIEKVSTSKEMKKKEDLPICQKPLQIAPTPSATRNRFYNSINSNYVLALVKQSIFLYGTLKLKTIAGTVDIFGYTSKIDEKVEIFSPKGYSSLEIRPKSNAKKTNMEKLNLDLLQQFENDFLLSDLKEIFSNFNSQTDAILYLERNDNDKKIVMIKKYMKENVFPNVNPLSPVTESLSEMVLRCVFNSQCHNGTKIDAKWKNIAVKNNSKLMIIGGKGVGKSTLLRYLVNTTLSNNCTEKILIIDLDIGQPELFIPQTISATVIDKPLLGPGYFHGYVPNKSYAFGSINVVLSPLTYLENVEELIKYCYEINDFKNIPWIVNTMGYNKGFGSELIANISKLLKPTEIVQIQSQQEINNFDFIMDKETIDSIPNLMFKASNNDLKLEHRTTVLKSCLRGNSHRKGEWNMSPNDMRHTSLLSRFGTILDAGTEWLTDVKPVCTSISDLKIITFGEEKLDRDELINSIIGNFVYLCQKSENCKTVECYGIGIVRAVDLNQQKVYLLPSCSEDKLMHVNCLAICNIPLPTSISLNQGPKIKATVPYVYNTTEFDASKFTKQIYFRPETYFQGYSQPILD